MEDTLLQVNMLAQASSEDEKELRRKAAQILKKKQVESLTPERRSEIGRIGARARWTPDEEVPEKPPKRRRAKKKKKH